ncbi:MAG: septum formation protein Maf [Nanoarchaeota archaeon]|nr:septum formation protein Maf [Nanoarchaeota archaeon]MBU4116383.1 septum formation protein Maf [Nanoarchaeota archaeon]
MNQQIILATTSKYRKEVFGYAGYDFIAQGSNIEENFKGRPNTPKELVETLSRLKAENVAKEFKSGLVIGFDSIGHFNGQILEKPKSKEEAYKRLKSLSGNKYEFFTGVHIIDLDRQNARSKVVKTEVFMRQLYEDEIKKYLEEDSSFNTYAQGFDPLQTRGMTFIQKINGSYNNILRGIPLESIVEILNEVGDVEKENK